MIPLIQLPVGELFTVTGQSVYRVAVRHRNRVTVVSECGLSKGMQFDFPSYLNVRQLSLENALERVEE